MAGVHYAMSSFLTAANNTPLQRKTTLASVSVPSPSKLGKRKNYLRPKLLKNLTKPYSNPRLPQESPENATIVVEADNEVSIGQNLDLRSDHESSGICRHFTLEYSGTETMAPEGSQDGEKKVSEIQGITEIPQSDVVVFSTSSVIKLGLYVAGVFVFQTICAVLLLGSSDCDQKDGNSEAENNSRLSGYGKLGISNSNLSLTGQTYGIKSDDFVYVDDPALEDKIVEIRKMAREARKSEEEELKSNSLASSMDDDDGIDESAVSAVRNDIQTEIDGKLGKLQKKLHSIREKSPLSSVNILSKSSKSQDEENKDSLDVIEAFRSLMFEKKTMYRDFQAVPRTNPKGFQPSRGRSDTKTKSTDFGTTDAMMRAESGTESLAKDDVEKKQSSKDTEVTVGVTQQTSQENHSDETIISRESQISEEQNYQTFPTEKGRKPVANKVGSKGSNMDIDSWWLNLPYVLAIFMRRSSGHEDPGGLYKFKIPSQTNHRNNSSYTVAFEDRTDANNFCYLLESFFQELGDFSADIVPISTKELDGAVKSFAMKVIVVKKGELHLYAGQPLADVEVALCSLVP